MGGSIALIPSASSNNGPFRGGTVNVWRLGETSVGPPVGVSSGVHTPQRTAFPECLKPWRHCQPIDSLSLFVHFVLVNEVSKINI